MSDVVSPETLTTLARACAEQLPAEAQPPPARRAAWQAQLDALAAALSRADVRYAFDRDGRPGAIAAVRSALPAMEADLLDAILEDVTCELAAYQEALYRVALEARRRD